MKDRDSFPCRPSLTAAACLVLTVCPALPGMAAESDGAARPNVLFLLSDDQRPDTIHALGNEHIRTPHLDRLVAEGTALTRAICPYPLCVPSRAEIMTGTDSFHEGQLDIGRRVGEEGIALWAETMRQAGYRTVYTGKWHTSGRPPQRGYEESRMLFAGGGGRWWVPTFDWNGQPVTGYRGWIFQTADREMKPELGVGLTPNISEHFAEGAISAIRDDSDRPFFLHVNFAAPHDPLLMPFGYADTYDPADMPVSANFLPEHPFDHGNFRGRDEKLFDWPRTRREVRRELAVYYAVITHMDAQIGRILDALEETDQLENTIVIFASDHGLAIGSHGLRGKQNMYEHTVGVPLIFRGPGIRAGRRVDAQCYLRDLFPTVCELADIEVPESVESRSLVPVLAGKKESIYPHVFGYFHDAQRMIRTDRYKLIRYPQADRRQLFDLQNDPHEMHNLADDPQYAEVFADLHDKLRAWQKRNGDPVLRGE